MSGETELKPCPFCLGSARTITASQSIAGVDMVMCNGCGCRFYGANAEKWNRRATPPGLETVPEGTMAALEAIISATEFTEILQGPDGRPCEVFLVRTVLRDAIHQCRAILTRHRATQDGK